MTPGRRGWIVLVIIAAVSLSTCAHAAPGHEHHSAAGRFYQTWQMPDAPHVSCCSDQDCGPAQSKFEGGHWWARWTDDEEWTRIPDAKVEHDRDTPDGRAHMCGRKSFSGDFVVFCFVTGAGG